MKKITEKWLKEIDACRKGIKWFNEQKETDAVKVVRKLMDEDNFSWANWTVSRLLPHKDKIKYAVFAAEQVFHLWAKKYPKEAAIWRKWVDGGCKKKNAANAADAADTAYATANAATAANAADAAANATYATADTAYATAYAAANAATAADAAADAAANATYATANATARKEMKTKIISYGIELLGKEARG